MRPSQTERLWTPWRMNYVGGGTKEDGCIFCNRLQRTDDVASLILHRSANTFVIMNLFPYNTGHIMLVPNQHAADPADLNPATLAEIGMSLPTLTNALRRTFDCHGFNMGLNIGAMAGAGVEAHLHQHIVPRWQGDANFMPIIASTMTIPELIPVTYAKIRAELVRELTGATTARFVLLDTEAENVLFLDGRLPQAILQPGTPILESIFQTMPAGLTDVQLVGWAGPQKANAPKTDDIALTLVGRLEPVLAAGWHRVRISGLDPSTDAGVLVQRAIFQRAPAR